MRRIARRLDLDALRSAQIGGKRALGLQRFERRRNASFDLREHVHGAILTSCNCEEKSRPA